MTYPGVVRNPGAAPGLWEMRRFVVSVLTFLATTFVYLDMIGGRIQPWEVVSSSVLNGTGDLPRMRNTRFGYIVSFVPPGTYSAGLTVPHPLLAAKHLFVLWYLGGLRPSGVDHTAFRHASRSTRGCTQHPRPLSHFLLGVVPSGDTARALPRAALEAEPSTHDQEHRARAQSLDRPHIPYPLPLL